jgi:hypothetical protein
MVATIGADRAKVNDLTALRARRIIGRIADKPTETTSIPQTMPLRAVCFDFDGVIADTENIPIAAW